MMAVDRAPGLGREYFGFLNWKQHDPSAWGQLLQEAKERARKGRSDVEMLFLGFDRDKKAVKQAAANASRAGLAEFITFDCRDVNTLKPPETTEPGLVITNPPYGERMGEKKSLQALYRGLGDCLKKGFSGWQASVFTANPDIAKHMGIRSKKHYKLFNGALHCRLLNFEIHPRWHMHERGPGRLLSERKRASVSDPGSEMFANRIRKNLKRVGKWARKNGITCYRLYDADMPEYAVAIDLYDNWAHVQEYQAPAGVEPENARRRLNQIMAVLPDVMKIQPEHIVLKVRKRTRGTEQYQRLGSSGRFFEVQENGLGFLVNLLDYLDTGLFLDHRITRQRIRD
jgi:23S rRNA (guanine2445-N2)-methyltransferase / 23S rRNA (guanine2069-N7)-methyltransferase